MIKYSLLAAFFSIFAIPNAYTADTPPADAPPAPPVSLAVNNVIPIPSVPVFAPQPAKKKSPFWSKLPCCGASSVQEDQGPASAVDVGQDLFDLSLLEKGEEIVGALKPLIIQYGPQVVDLVKTHGPELVDKVKGSLGTASDAKADKGKGNKGSKKNGSKKKDKKNKAAAETKLRSIDGMTDNAVNALVPMVQKHGDVVVNTVSMYKDEHGGVEKVADAILDVDAVYFS